VILLYAEDSLSEHHETAVAGGMPGSAVPGRWVYAGLRKYVGKSHCTVIDFIGNFKNAHRILDYQGLLPLKKTNRQDLVEPERGKRF
jgi:hypothetical protein